MPELGRILVLGGSSFLGWHCVKHLAARGFGVTATWLTSKPPVTPGVDLIKCHLLSRADLGSIDKHDAVVLYASAVVGEEKRARNVQMTRNVADYCRDVGARLVYISSSQVGFDITTEYRTSKLESEQIVLGLGNGGTIIRPAAPYGASHEFTLAREQPFHVLARTISKMPIVPVIGKGTQYRQPVHVSNLNQLVEWACFADAAAGGALEIGGAERMTMNDLVARMGRAAGKPNLHLVHLPVPMFQIAARFTSFIDPENTKAVTCDESADNNSWEQYTQLDLVPFDEGIKDLFKTT